MAKRRHRNPDHVQRHNTPRQDNEAIADQLKALLTPVIWAQQAYYRQLGLRDRKLEFAVNDGSGVNPLLEASPRSPGVNTNTVQLSFRRY